MTTIRLIHAIILSPYLKLEEMDVKAAFLNDELEENIYIEELECFMEKDREHLVCKLHKSIYGLKQSSRQWYCKFMTWLWRMVSSCLMRTTACTPKGLDQTLYLSLYMYVTYSYLKTNCKSSRKQRHGFPLSLT